VSRRLLLVETSAWGGGLERVVLGLARAAPSQGWEALIAHWRNELPPDAIVPSVRLHAGRVLRRWPIQLGTLLRRYQPDVVHLHGPTAGSIGALAASRTRACIVYTDHAVHRDRPLLLRSLRRATARIPAMSIAISDAVRRSLIEDAGAPRSRVVIVPNGVEAAPPAHRTGEAIAAYVANMWPRKDHAGLLSALRATRVPIRLVLVGDGPERAEIERSAEAQGLTDRVAVLGRLADPWAGVGPIRFVVHAPREEAMGLAPVEAMMRGYPVVATRVGGIPDVIEDGRTGLLVAHGDPGGLAEAMDRLATDDALCDRLGVAARAEAVARFSLAANVSATFALYERLLNGR
jgi:glycosyltransferase involved in cell wall biosynthesis